MGFTPQQVAAMSFFEWECVSEGWRRAHMSEKQRAYEDQIPQLTAAELHDFLALPPRGMSNGN